jgi:hypothetical protein
VRPYLGKNHHKKGWGLVEWLKVFKSQYHKKKKSRLTLLYPKPTVPLFPWL